MSRKNRATWRMGSGISVLAALVVMLAVFPESLHGVSSASASVPRASGPLADPEHDCFEAVPEAVSVGGVTDGGQTVSLDILVLLDDLTSKRGRDVVKTMAESYEPLAIEIVPRFRKVAFADDGAAPPESGAPPAMAGDAYRIIDDAKALFGGERPAGIDIVLILTGKDIYYGEGTRQYSLAGVADCIGGVRYPDHAFAISEGMSRWEVRVDDEFLSGKIAAHEVGHLMGAHHHYGNCAQGDQHPEGSNSFCTVMFPSLISYMARNFGTVEASVVRGHAVDFASP